MDRYIIGLGVSKAHHNLVRQLERSMQAVGSTSISATTGRIIANIVREYRDHDVYQRDIEGLLGLKPSSVSLILNTMEKNGYIMRASVSHDARLKKLTPTQKAIDIYPEILKSFDRVENVLWETLTEDEVAVLEVALKKLELLP